MNEYNYIEEEQGNMVACEPSSWGGQWTEEKLDAFEKYVNAYLTIMNSHRGNYRKLIYFDGFAGSGSRNEVKKEPDSELLQDLFRDCSIEERELETYKGAAERVLSIAQEGFDFYYFVDKDKESSLKLHELLAPFENDKTLVYRNSDANKQVELLAKAMRDDTNLAALVLLDPFGMQVDWKSIELLKGTRTDLWILIPTGVIDESFLKDYFYKKKTVDTLFGEKEIIEKVKKPIEKIAELYIEQLKTIFEYVTEKPLVLYNSRKTPIFHFACASNNSTAIKIASQIINKKQSK